MALAVQYLLVGIAVVLAALYLWRSRFPRAWRATRMALAIPLLRASRPGWAQALGRAIAPASAPKSSECGGCDGCS
ncbi:DUF6587 family protein [Luteimonas sp. e5]